MKQAQGTLQSKFYVIIPFLLVISISRITNGKHVDIADKEATTGRVISIHITPFIAFGFVIPNMLSD